MSSEDRTVVFANLLPAARYTIEVTGRVQYHTSPPGHANSKTGQQI